MFRVHTPIIRSIRRWDAAYGSLNRVFGCVVVLRAAAGVVFTVRMVPCDRTAPSAPHTRPTQRLSRPPSIQKLGGENHMLHLNVWCSWWWAYVPETCRAKNILIKLPRCIKLPFQIISRWRCTVKQPSSILIISLCPSLFFLTSACNSKFKRDINTRNHYLVP